METTSEMSDEIQLEYPKIFRVTQDAIDDAAESAEVVREWVEEKFRAEMVAKMLGHEEQILNGTEMLSPLDSIFRAPDATVTFKQVLGMRREYPEIVYARLKP